MTTIAPVNVSSVAAPPAAPPSVAPSTAARFGFGDDGFTFGDLLDIINPLQHIPIVGTIYRAITGDQMAPASEIAGGALYGGPIGALLSVADVAFTDATGKPIDQTMLAWVGIGDDAPTPTAPPAVVAQRATPSPAQNPALRAMPARAFPAATSRIVPMAYYAQPIPASPASAGPAAVAATTAPAATAAAVATSSPTSIVPPQPAASAAAEPPAAIPASTQPELQGAQALLAALRDFWVDPASAARAAAAYQASVVMQSPLVRAPATDQLH